MNAQHEDAQFEEEGREQEEGKEYEEEEEEATFLWTPLACFDLTYNTKFVRLPIRYKETYMNIIYIIYVLYQSIYIYFLYFVDFAAEILSTLKPKL